MTSHKNVAKLQVLAERLVHLKRAEAQIKAQVAETETELLSLWLDTDRPSVAIAGYGTVAKCTVRYVRWVDERRAVARLRELGRVEFIAEKVREPLKALGIQDEQLQALAEVTETQYIRVKLDKDDIQNKERES